MVTRRSRRMWIEGLLMAAAAIGWRPWQALAQPQPQEPEGRRAFTLVARTYLFDPDVLDVRRNDVVRISITSEDIAHSFTIDRYRVQKRIPAGGTVSFEFRADEAGRFPFYCSMRADPRCREMRGELIVR